MFERVPPARPGPPFADGLERAAERHGADMFLQRAEECHHLRGAEAHRKSLALLREWLSPEQLAQVERKGSFEVIGSKTGKRYRIQRGTLQNVFELDQKGRPVRGWCFVPAGFLPAGDVMVAQKIALEEDEEAAMKVARPFWTEVGLSGFMRWIGDLRWALPTF